MVRTQTRSSIEKIASGYNGKNIEKEVFCTHRDDENQKMAEITVD